MTAHAHATHVGHAHVAHVEVAEGRAGGAGVDGDAGSEDSGADAVVAGGAFWRLGGLTHLGQDIKDVGAFGALVLVHRHNGFPP